MELVLNICIHIRYFCLKVPNLEVRPKPKGHKTKLRAHEMINDVEINEKKGLTLELNLLFKRNHLESRER